MDLKAATTSDDNRVGAKTNVIASNNRMFFSVNLLLNHIFIYTYARVCGLESLAVHWKIGTSTLNNKTAAKVKSRQCEYLYKYLRQSLKKRVIKNVTDFAR